MGHCTKYILKQSILLRIKRAIQKYKRVNSSIGNIINIYEPKTAKIHIFGCQRNLYFSVVTVACLYESCVTTAELTSNHWKWNHENILIRKVIIIKCKLLLFLVFLCYLFMSLIFFFEIIPWIRILENMCLKSTRYGILYAVWCSLAHRIS